MNSRRAFLRMAPIAAVIVAAPVAATVVAVNATRESVPMRGTVPPSKDPFALYPQGDWSMLQLSTAGDLPKSTFVSHSMRKRSDGLYELVFERDA